MTRRSLASREPNLTFRLRPYSDMPSMVSESLSVIIKGEHLQIILMLSNCRQLMVVADVGAISETGFDGFPKDFDNKITEITEPSSSGHYGVKL